MDEQEIKYSYREPISRHVQRIIFILFSIPASGLFVYLSTGKIISNYIIIDIKELVSWSILFVLMIIYIIITLAIIYELKRNLVVVELFEYKIGGRPRIGKINYEMKFEDIIKISTGSWSAPLGVILADRNNNKIVISVYIEPFRECLEKIISKATNLKILKIDAIKKNTIIWK